MNEQMRRSEAAHELLIFVRQAMLGVIGGGIHHVKQVETLERGRYTRAAAVLRSKIMLNHEYALKSAVSAGEIGDDLLQARVLTSAWMSLLSSRTLLGRIPFRSAPFNTPTIKESAPGSAAWVAQGVAIPLSRFSLDSASLDISKIAGLLVFTREQIESTARSALANVNRAMLAVIGRYSDEALLNPGISAVTAKNPASLTNAGTQMSVSGNTEATITADVKAMLQKLVDFGADLSQVVIAMHPLTAVFMSAVLTAGGERAYPNLGARGGDLFGVPVLTSVGAVADGSPSERIIAAINPEGVLVADDGDIDFSASKTTSIQMDNAPGSKSTPTATGASLVSMFQTESVALRFTRYINWTQMTGAVAYMRVGY